MLWDIDFAFGGDPNDPNLFGIGGAEHGPRNDHPPFRRIYWQALIEAANGMLMPARSNPILDARYNGMVAAGASIGSPDGIKNFIATRRSVILTQVAANQSPFAITSNGGADFTNAHVNAWIWDGSAWGNFVAVTTSAGPVNTDNADIAWESNSGHLLTVAATTGTNIVSKEFTSSWGSAATFACISAGATLQYTRLKANPLATADDMVLAVVDSTSAGLGEQVVAVLSAGRLFRATRVPYVVEL